MLFRKISALVMKSGSDFDKYEALRLAEELASCASKAHGEKFTFQSFSRSLACVSLGNPNDQLTAYFLALFSHHNYGKVMESLTKLDKSLRDPRSGVCGVPGPASPRPAQPASWSVSAFNVRRSTASSVSGPTSLLCLSLIACICSFCIINLSNLPIYVLSACSSFSTFVFTLLYPYISSSFLFPLVGSFRLSFIIPLVP